MRKLLRLGGGGGGPARRGCSTSATTPSATWPRRSRCCCRRPERRDPTGRCTSGSRSGCCRCATLEETGEARRWCSRRGTRWTAAAVRLEQADHRRVPRRRVAARCVIRALAQAQRPADATLVAHRLMGDVGADARSSTRRCVAPDARRRRRQPALSVLPRPPARGRPGDARRRRPTGRPSGSGTASARSSSAAAGQTFVWSRGEELVTDRFPEIAALRRRCCPTAPCSTARSLPWKDGAVAAVRRAAAADRPQDARQEAPAPRCRWSCRLRPARARAASTCASVPLRERRERGSRRWSAARGRPALLPLAASCRAPTWEALRRAARGRARARRRGADAEAARRRRTASAGVRGDWWKWKVEPFTVDAVLIYAQRGNGKRASLYTDYTFGVWDERRARAVRQGLLAA